MRTRIITLALALGVSTQALASDLQYTGDYVQCMSYYTSFWVQNAEVFDKSKSHLYRNILLVDMEALVQKAPHLQYLDDLQLQLARDDPRFNDLLFPGEVADQKQLKAVEDALLDMGKLELKDPNYVPKYALTVVKLDQKVMSLYGHILNIFQTTPNLGIVGLSKAPYSKRQEYLDAWEKLGINIKKLNQLSPQYKLLNTNNVTSQKVMQDAGYDQGVFFINGYSREDSMKYIWGRLQAQYSQTRGLPFALNTMHLSRGMTVYNLAGEKTPYVYYEGSKRFLQQMFNHRTFFVQRLPLSFQKFTQSYRIFSKLSTRFFALKAPVILPARGDGSKKKVESKPLEVAVPKVEILKRQQPLQSNEPLEPKEELVEKLSPPFDEVDSLDIRALVLSYPPLSNDEIEVEEDLLMKYHLWHARLLAHFKANSYNSWGSY